MLHQAVLLPEPETMTSVQDQMQHACTLYQTYLDRHQDIDDFDVLLDVLNELSAAHDMVFWMGSEGVSTIAWYIQNAMVHNDGHIDITLDPIQLTYWGPKSFMTSVMQTLEHENIHLKQRDKMGAQKFKTLPSGYQIGLQKAEHVEEHQKHRTVMRSYFRDPHELMAHGHDVCREAQQAGNPLEILRNPEQHRELLLTYDKHRQVFPPNAKPLQRLLSYAYEYLLFYENA